jgi:hypothetical protein
MEPMSDAATLEAVDGKTLREAARLIMLQGGKE